MKTIDKFVIENAVSVQGSDGAYYHHLEVCKLLKLQQERSYSEEDMKDAYIQGTLGLEYKKNFNESFYKWFKQFKNK